MNKLLGKSLQTRLTVLIGVLIIVASITTILGIVNAAAFQVQLDTVEKYTDALQDNAKAHASQLKTQIALKNIVIASEGQTKDYGDYWQYSNQFIDYLTLESLRNPSIGDLWDSHDAYLENSRAVLDAVSAEEVDYAALERMNIEEVDPASDTVELKLSDLYDQDLQALRNEIIAIQTTTQNSIVIGQITLIILAGILIWSVYEMMHISQPLDNLTGAIVAFENKTYNPEFLASDSQRTDELGELARAVDGMATSITESNRLKEQFLQAAQRFIPSQYLEFLEKDSITSVNLGDHVSAEMAVMFSDIRGFTTMSEKMTAKENFDFVNEYLKLVSPIIQKHEGFVVKFLGDGMMAIFPYGVADAVRAGIEKAQAVQSFNEMLKSRGLPTISVGIGVHTGPMMVGMIGEDFRMQGDAFSDNVNLTSRIEGLNKYYGTSMIISEDTLKQLPQPITFKMRSLGKAVVKGRANPLGMYEVYEGLSAEAVAIKESTREGFEQAIDFFAKGNISEAGKAFHAVLQRDPSDKTAKMYLEYCADLISKPLPENWNGAIVMDSK